MIEYISQLQKMYSSLNEKKYELKSKARNDNIPNILEKIITSILENLNLQLKHMDVMKLKETAIFIIL